MARAYAVALNDHNGSEFCGPAFPRGGRYLFANIQFPDLTPAITGPWTRPSEEPAA